jgi:hypothetical protein
MEDNVTIKDALKKETGLVGFFDILGYKSFLEPGITDVTFKVINVLDGLKNRVELRLKDHLGLRNGSKDSEQARFGGDLFEKAKQQVEQINLLVVSDSILLLCPYDEQIDNPSQAATFVVAAFMLERIMFEEGLPLRGAIAFGDFISKGCVFAGKPIIDAYELGDSLDMSACAIHSTAETEFQRLVVLVPALKGFLNEGTLLVRHPVSIKKAETGLPLLFLNFAWSTPTGYKPLKYRHDLRQYVHEQFLAHNKQIASEAISKVENTDRFFRFLKHRFPILFERD